MPFLWMNVSIINRQGGRLSRRASASPSGSQDRLELRVQGRELVRLLDEAGEAFSHEMLDRLLLALPAGEKDLEARDEPAHLAKRLLSVHCRHGQVEDDAGDFFPLHADDVKGFPAVRRDKCDESQVLQHLAANNPDAHFVVNEENGAITLNLPVRLSSCLNNPDNISKV